MKLKILHETSYKFNTGVFIQPHYLRFRPKTTPQNHIENFKLLVDPNPNGLLQQADPENNVLYFGWFSGIHEELTIKAESIVITHKKDPFDFILYPDNFVHLPFHYPSHLQDTLRPNLSGPAIGDALIAYGDSILVGSNYNTLDFITNLTHRIYQDFRAESRLYGEPYFADYTFGLKRGTCRDLSWMQIQLLRYLGIAARFVSGYLYKSTESSAHELHAWIEVYLPGAGWVGFDPSNGLVTDNTYIPVCSSAHYENTMPVTGSFTGSTGSHLSTSLSIEVID